MADPVTIMAGASLATSIVGGGLNALGASKKGEADAKMFRYQSGVALINKQIADQNAAHARATGESQAVVSGMKAKQQMGAIKTVQAASGTDVTSGTNVDVQNSQQEISGYEQNVIRNEAAWKAYGYEVEGAKDVSQAGAYNAAASNAKSGGDLSMWGSILGTTGSVAGKWAQGSNAGMWGNTSNLHADEGA